MLNRLRKVVLFLLVFLLLLAFLPPLLLGVIFPAKYSDLVELYSAEFQISSHIIYAIIKTESNFDKDAVSPAGASGLMQLMPDTFSWIAEVLGESREITDIFNPEINIRDGVFYLNYLYQHYLDWNLVFAAYNAGMGNVNRWLLSPQYSREGKLTYIPFQETRNYVRLISRRAKIYKKLYSI